MKKKLILMPLLVLALIASMEVPVAAQTTLNVGPGETYTTIQAAINAAGTGDTIIVAAGTYNESILIGKALTVKSTDGAENTKIDVPGGTGIEIKASGVTVEGFKVSGDNLHYGIIVRKGVEVEVLNNVVTGTTKHGAIELYEGDLAKITVSGNVIDNCAYGIVVGGGSSFSISDSTISNNTITDSTGGNWGAIPLSGEISDITIDGNEISNNENMNGILLGAGTYENIVIKNNVVSSNSNGVQIKGKAGFTNLAINHNNIVGNANYGIENAGNLLVDATNNWWGDASGPNHPTSWDYNGVEITNPDGEGDPVSDNVIYEPWSLPEPTPEPEPVEPKPEPDPNRFQVFMRFGYDSTKYVNKSDDTLRGDIEASGEYGDTQYMLMIPKGCAIERPSGKRLHSLFLKEIDGDVLTFTTNDVDFSEPCVLYIAEGGKLYQDYWTGQWLGGTWVEVGSFTSIIDGEAVLD